MKAEDLLVSTKFAPPRIGPRYVVRNHLLQQLKAARGSTLVLVVGSAGFGKTVLLAQWRQELLKSGAEIAWLSLTHEDERPSSFSAYLLAAMQQLGVPVEADLLMEGDDVKSMDAAIALTVNGAARLARDLYLIVDDYHQVDDPWVHRFMQKLVDLCPPNLHVVIASRSLPPLNVSRLRVAGRLAELGLDELPFDLHETRTFFEQNLGTVKLSGDELQLLHDVTGGWPASLQLLATVIKGRPKARLSLRQLGGSSRDLQAYLAEDVVSHLPDELNAFIEKISICRRFNTDLARALTGEPRAAEFIRRIEEENLLIYPVDSDDRSPWYRFHPLFGEFLATRLSRLGREAVDELHRKASQWFADNGLLSEAVRHATLANDLQFAVEAIERTDLETWDFEFIAPMLGLLERLPPSTLLSSPRLFILSCLAFAMIAHPAKAERWIVRARKESGAKTRAIVAALAVAAGTLAYRLDDTSQVIACFEDVGQIPFRNPFVRYFRSTALATAYAAEGDYARAHRLLDENLQGSGEAREELVLLNEGSRASLFLIQGNVQEAERLSAAVLSRVEATHGRHFVSANLSAAILGDVYYETDRIEDARKVIANRPRILDVAVPETMIRAAVCHARLDFIQESADAALAFLSSYVTYYQRLGLDRPKTHLLAEQVRILLDAGRRQRAVELMAGLEELDARYKNARGFWGEIPALVGSARGRILLSNGRYTDALKCLQDVRQYAENRGRGRLLVRANLLSAAALEGNRQKDEAAQSLIQALRLGQDLGLVRAFLDEGEVVRELLVKLGRSGVLEQDDGLRSYLDGLLVKIGKSDSAMAGVATADAAAGALGEAGLTPREVEILALICQAMTNKRIALALNITLETVKWNVKNILAKLGVSSRYDAIAWARKHGIGNQLRA